MTEKLKQFVPSDVCLKCDGCCRFKESDSHWRPKIAKEEAAAAKTLGLADQIFSQDVIAPDSYIRTKPGCGEHFCSFFNAQDHTCAIYKARPFECELYPFVISRDPNGTGLYVHLNCPHVEANYRRDSDYVRYLKDYLARPDVREYLRRNKALLHDYSNYKDELEFLFPLEI
jgi:Fe-S-cluster containining protein